jgi:hypothetical protein
MVGALVGRAGLAGGGAVAVVDQVGGEAIEGAFALLSEGDDAGARLLRG